VLSSSGINGQYNKALRDFALEGPGVADPVDFPGFLRRVWAAELVIRRAVRLRLSDPALRRLFDSADVCQSALASSFVRAAAGPAPPQLAARRGQGASWAEITAELGGTPDGRRVRLARALDRVTRELGLEEGDE
jgi:hypothetical protein